VQRTSSFILRLEETGAEDLPLVGGKGANLGELTEAGVPVPPAFIITSMAYRHFLQTAQLSDVLRRQVANVNVEDPERLTAVSSRVRKLITTAALPDDLVAAIKAEYAALGGVTAVAVRSSATAEDQPEASFAGQYSTLLNVRGIDHVLAAIKSCWASLFEERALFYRSHQGIDQMSLGMAVVVQRMVQAEVSGVMFTADPVTNDVTRMMIEASFGLGEAVVSGLVTPDLYGVDKGSRTIVDRTISRQEWKLVQGATGDISENERIPLREAEGGRQKLPDARLLDLAEIGMRIEQHFGWPQDIEWALEGNQFFVVQARPVTTLGGVGDVPFGPRKELTGKLLVSGAAASPGVASGTVRILLDPTRARDVQPGDILVTAAANPDYVPAMKRAKAIITDTGGRTSHAAILSRELGIPCVVGADNATKLLHDGQLVTVDGTWGRVLEGAVTIKSTRTQRQRVAVKTRTHVMVNLIDPESAEAVAARDVDGIGLLRAEVMVAATGEHPRHALETGKSDAWIEQLADGIEKFCAAFAPRPVLYRTTDFKTNEYRTLEGGAAYEAEEENPMLGFRGAARYLADPEAFGLEVAAIKRVRRKYSNLSVMIPFVRATRELQEVKRMLAAQGLRRSKTFELWMMAEIPSNVLLLEQFLDVGIDGISVGSNDLTQLILGVDRDNPKLADMFDERSPAVMLALEHVVTTCKRRGVKVSICGEAPSVYPEITRRLVEWGIDSISVSPDMIDDTRRIVADAERRLAQETDEQRRQPRMPIARP